MRRKENLHQHELIGLRLRVVRSVDPGVEGMEGTVVDETREMLTVERDGGRADAWVPKRGTQLELVLEDGSTAALEGDRIAFRPEDRTKRARGGSAHVDDGRQKGAQRRRRSSPSTRRNDRSNVTIVQDEGEERDGEGQEG
jgi:ribonuclease P protein subunit POP4